jgi:hypothetical protein
MLLLLLLMVLLVVIDVLIITEIRVAEKSGSVTTVHFSLTTNRLFVFIFFLNSIVAVGEHID